MHFFENFFANLNFWQWQTFIAVSIFLLTASSMCCLRLLIASPKLIAKGLAHLITAMFNITFLWTLVDWTWDKTYGTVFVSQIIVIIFSTILSRFFVYYIFDFIPKKLFILSPLLFTFLICFTGYNAWKEWDLENYQCQPPKCEPKEKVICFTEGSRTACYTATTYKLFYFSHCVNTSGMLPGYGRWENQKCYDEKGNIVSEADWD